MRKNNLIYLREAPFIEMRIILEEERTFLSAGCKGAPLVNCLTHLYINSTAVTVVFPNENVTDRR